MSYSARVLATKTMAVTERRLALRKIAAEADATIADLVAALIVAREELHYHRDSGDDISGSAMATIDAALAAWEAAK